MQRNKTQNIETRDSRRMTYVPTPGPSNMAPIMTSLSSKSMSSSNNSDVESPSSSLDAWTSEIRQASDDLTFATSKLESMFEELSSSQEEQELVAEGKSQRSSSSSSMPTATCNPIKLLRRLASLEYSIQRIRKDGLEVTQKRDELLDDLMETQQQNHSMLRQISSKVD